MLAPTNKQAKQESKKARKFNQHLYAINQQSTQSNARK
jgi:hypothetical protein